MTILEKLLIAIYGRALHLYPRAFREKYANQMIDAARNSYAETNNRGRLIPALALDTVTSALREHRRAATWARPGYAAAFALLATMGLLAASVVNQQVLRRGADLQPQRLATEIQQRVEKGEDAASLVTGTPSEIDSPAWIARAQPFVAIYNSEGKPLAANATLHGLPPRPPIGVFQHTKFAGLDKVTWQPTWRIRIALVVHTLSRGRFVIAGQSLIPSESREIRFHMLLIWTWLILMIAALAFYIVALRHNHASRT